MSDSLFCVSGDWRRGRQSLSVDRNVVGLELADLESRRCAQMRQLVLFEAYEDVFETVLSPQLVVEQALSDFILVETLKEDRTELVLALIKPKWQRLLMDSALLVSLNATLVKLQKASLLASSRPARS